MKVILVCGPVGAGKTTYSMALAQEIEAIRFSIDPWMQTLFAKDMKSLDYAWILERVDRCHQQIWEVAEQILQLNGNVILDLGFTTQKHRDRFKALSKAVNLDAEIHYLQADITVRIKIRPYIPLKSLILCSISWKGNLSRPQTLN